MILVHDDSSPLAMANEATDVSAFWRNVEPIVEAGKTLIISHHMRKGSNRPNSDSFELASGSTDILAGSTRPLPSSGMPPVTW
jgi:hypothetical protein